MGYQFGELFLSGKIIEEFVIELLIAEILFCWCLPRKEKFIVKCVRNILFLLCISFYWPFKNYSQEMESYVRILCILRYTGLFLLSVGGILNCFQCTLNDAFFCGIGAYAMQHFSFCTNRVVTHMLEYAGMDISMASYVLIVSLSCIFTYILFYFIFIRWTYREKVRTSRDVILPALVVLLFTASVNLYQYENVYCNLCGMVICMLTVWILQGLFKNGQLQQELDRIYQMRSLKEEYYHISKENIQAINLKCHDLKHQIKRIRRMSKESEADSYLDEVEKKILLYDAVAHTGSLVLDTILTDKILYCEKYEIKLSYMADGEKLNFMEEADLYNLFGNAIDNAVESTLKVEDKDRRVISLIIKTVGSFLSIHLDNTFEGTLKYENGLPVTTKKETRYHGYGIKSIQMTVEKYGGKLSISAEDQIFNLNILFPVSDVVSGHF